MLTRFKLLLLITVVLLATTAIAQSEPSAPSPAPAPEVAAPSAPATPAAPAAHVAKGAKAAVAPSAPVAPASPAGPVAPKAPVPPEPPRHFQLEYVVKEVENGKVTNSRSYSIIVCANKEGRREQIRTGSRLPVQTAPGNNLNAQYQYIDLGVNIDSSDIREEQGQLSLRVSADISSLGGKEPSGMPIVRQNRWDSAVIVPIGKAATIFSSDDVASVRSMQLDLKATPVK